MITKRLIEKGEKFGRLVIIERIPTGRNAKYVCYCTCGKKITVSRPNLISGNTKSCGCLKKENQVRHGLSKEDLYRVHMNMMARCYNINDINYHNYGAREISVCKEWRDKKDSKGLISFYNWAIENGWKPGLEIDRKNVNKNYTPKNCRFVTSQINSNNKRNTKKFIVDGVSMSLSEIARKTGIGVTTLHYRVTKGLSIEDAINIPINKGNTLL